MVACRVSKAQEVLYTAFGDGGLVTPSEGNAGGAERSRDIVQAALVVRFPSAQRQAVSV